MYVKTHFVFFLARSAQGWQESRRTDGSAWPGKWKVISYFFWKTAI